MPWFYRFKRIMQKLVEARGAMTEVPKNNRYSRRGDDEDLYLPLWLWHMY